MRLEPKAKAAVGIFVLLLGLVGWAVKNHFAKSATETVTDAGTTTVVKKGADGQPIINKATGKPETEVVAHPNAAPAPAGNGPSTRSCGGAGEPACKIALSQWPGHSAGILACGGLTPQPGSYCTKVTSVIKPDLPPGLNVEFVFMETPDEKNVALQSGKVDAIWSTTDEMPINLPGFAKALVDIVSFVQIDWSRGGDGCAADASVTTPRDLLTHKGSVMKFSPDHTALEYYITNGDLTPAEVNKARANISFSPDDFTYARTLFCQNKVDVACLWEPDLSLALACRPNSHILFSTKDATTLIADNLFARKDWLAANPGVAEKIARIFMKGGELGGADKKWAAKLISTVEPRFRDELGYDKTLASLDWVRWNDLADNVAYFGVDGTPPKFDMVYKQADSIWSEYTETDGTPALSQRFVPSKLRDGSIIKAIYDAEKTQRHNDALATGKPEAPIAVDKPTYKPEEIEAAPAKLVKPVTINFDTGATALDMGARQILKAQVLTQVGLVEGMGFRIEGNTDDTGNRAANIVLSKKRAAAVRDFLISQGMDANRVVAEGKGPDNPKCNAKTPDCRAANRRTDIVFVSATGN